MSRRRLRTLAFLLLPAAGAAAAIAAVVTLDQRVQASNDARVQVGDVKATLNTLQWVPYQGTQSPAYARAQMARLEGELLGTVDRLAARPEAPSFARVRVNLEDNFDALHSLYVWATTDAGSMSTLTPLGWREQTTLGGANVELTAVEQAYAGAARRAEIEAVAGSALAIVILLGGFSFFYVRSVRARRLLEEATRAKDEIISLVSHELRTPLTSINGFAEILLEEDLGDEQVYALKIIERNGKRLLALVNDLLITARLEAGTLSLQRSDVDVAALVAQAVDAAAPAAEKRGVRLVLQSEGEVHVAGDATRLGQTIDNLLSNAIKFTPEGGEVVVRLATSSGQALLSVSDTGMGIPADEQEHVFERFFRSSISRDTVGGTGLGLVVTRGLVEAHGGTIDFESREGAGTTFRVELPLAQAEQLLAKAA